MTYIFRPAKRWPGVLWPVALAVLGLLVGGTLLLGSARPRGTHSTSCVPVPAFPAFQRSAPVVESWEIEVHGTYGSQRFSGRFAPGQVWPWHLTRGGGT